MRSMTEFQFWGKGEFWIERAKNRSITQNSTTIPKKPNSVKAYE